MEDGRDGRGGNGPGRGDGASIDELLDRAVAAVNRGDRATASALAGQVLAVDGSNADAEDLLAAHGTAGEIRRLAILFAELVDSTALSTRVEPETYRLLLGRYRDLVLQVVNRFEGHFGSTKGDGLLAVFGHPRAHEDDVRRAVAAGVDITRVVAGLSEQVKRRFGVEIQARVGVHRGLVYLDTAQDDVYGHAANLAARVSGLAPPGSVVVSDTVTPLIRKFFELEERLPAPVKGVDAPLAHHRVVRERPEPATNRGPLVGRERELARLQTSWARAQAGMLSTQGLMFRGEPGIGKSRMAAAASELVEVSGGVVVHLFGSPFHTDVGLHPVRALLERRCGIGRLNDPEERLGLLDAEVRARLLDPANAVPLLAPVLGIGSEAGYEPVPAEGRKLHELITEAVQTYLLACLGDGAGLVVAEDMQWFDTSTMEVLGGLLSASGGRLLVVITGRPGNRLPDDWPVEVIELKALTDEQTDELITALDPTISAEDRSVVRTRCDGVPFYIEQVVNGLREEGVPEALYEPLVARLHASANVVPVVEAAAVIGRHLDRGLLCSVVDLSEQEVDDVITELENALVLEPCGVDGWQFRHELLREVANELAPPSVRRRLHAKVADALVEGTGGDPDWRLVAGHYERAQRFDEAAAAYQRASADARRRGALAEARTFLTHALAQLDRCSRGLEHGRREISVRLERGFLAMAAEGYQSSGAAADFERCLQLCGTDLRDDELIATLTALTGYYIARADLRRGNQMLALSRAGLEEGRQWFSPGIEAGLGLLAWLRGELDIASSHLEQATAVQAASDRHDIDALWFLPADPIAVAHIYVALTRFLRGDLAGAEAELVLAARRAEQLGFPQGSFSLAYAHFVESWLRVEAGELERAAAVSADLSEGAERHGLDMWALYGATWQAAVTGLAALDATATALAAHIAALGSLVDTLRRLELNIYITIYDGVLAQLMIAAGQSGRARIQLDTALELADDTGMHFYDAELLRLRARTHTDPEARRRDIAAALTLARHQGAPLFELRAALDDFDLRGQSARAVLADAASRFPVGSSWPELTRAKVALKLPIRNPGHFRRD